MSARKIILIIDNDEAQLAIACSILKSEYEIIAAKSGEEGLVHLAKAPAPDLVLLDIRTPKMHGRETYNKIRAAALACGTPIVFLASKSETKAKDFAAETGAADYIIKPFVKEDLLQRVKHLIEHYKPN